MASVTKVFMTRNRLKQRKRGRKRKLRTAKLGSTLSRAVLFGEAAKA